MATAANDTKYGKYIYEYDYDNPEAESYPFGLNFPFRMITELDNTVISGSHFYLMHWVMPHEGPFTELGHPPHIHKSAELLFHIGTDPDNPSDLGAEVEFFLGKEMERHIITRTSVVLIPPNFIHAPWNPIKTTRPWIFVEVNQGSIRTEKGYHQLLSPEKLQYVNPRHGNEEYWE